MGEFVAEIEPLVDIHRTQMDEFLKRLETIHTPNEDEPWLEVEYMDHSDFHVFLRFINKFDNIGKLRQEDQPFFFRGQPDSRWTLKPRLVRLLESLPLKDALKHEFDSICYFRERAHLLTPALVPDREDVLEWLALMQHFSAPTRMLDWTSSFSVALYFAVCDEPLDVPGAVWVVQAESLWRWMNRAYPDPELRNGDRRREVFHCCDSFIEFGMHRATPRLNGYDPDRKSERATAQRGIFTVCERLFADHADLIGSALMEGAKSKENLPLLKVKITPEAKKFFRQYLSKLNITAATLFPGTDGLGRTVAETIRVQREVFQDVAHGSKAEV